MASTVTTESLDVFVRPYYYATEFDLLGKYLSLPIYKCMGHCFASGGLIESALSYRRNLFFWLDDSRKRPASGPVTLFCLRETRVKYTARPVTRYRSISDWRWS